VSWVWRLKNIDEVSRRRVEIEGDKVVSEWMVGQHSGTIVDRNELLSPFGSWPDTGFETISLQMNNHTGAA
jgi:hypothetical protein